MFFLTRAAVEILAPFNLALILLLTGFMFLVFRNKRRGMLSFGFGLFVLFFCGYGFFVKDYLAGQEQRFPPLNGEYLQAAQAKRIRHIVVLGSGHVSDNRLPVTSRIDNSSLYRLVEGVRIFRALPGSKLLISGGIGYDPRPNADVVTEVAVSIGVPAERIIVENRPRDTQQEARLLLPLLKKDEFILVTSALHMPRAMKTFQDLGMRPLPAPTDYILKRHLREPPGSYLPSMGNLDLARRLIYELIGRLWTYIQSH